MSNALSPEKALIFRIVHRDNLPWILDNGLHARNGDAFHPNYHDIGNPDLIDKRSRRGVPIAPGGTLNDYVPFYFTPYSIMMFNIKTGYGGVAKVPNGEIVIFVSSLHRLAELGIPFIFTNQHAYPPMAEYFSDLGQLGRIDWSLLQSRDFKHDPDDPGKKERYQAEALVWKHVPVDALLGICCNTTTIAEEIQAHLKARGCDLRTLVRPRWYF
ncbi:MAG: type II toxin-antitoxin system toxin DNA ADP-ribosyl transferase DarT [Gammaproteobacteria bacterium]